MFKLKSSLFPTEYVTVLTLINFAFVQGFRQTSLKTCSEVSQWTKLCEVQVPRDIAYLLKHNSIEEKEAINVPESIEALESILSQPVTTFNAVYRQQKLKKEKTTDIKSTQTQEFNDKKGMCLKPSYKNAAIVTDKRKYKQKLYGERSNQKEQNLALDLSPDFTQDRAPDLAPDLALHMSKLAVDAGTKNQQSSINRTNGTNPALQNGNLKETTCTSQHANRMAPSSSSKQDSLPCLQHTFAEGPDLTLVDIALFPYIQYYIAYTNLIGATQVLSMIPLVVKWYTQMLDVPNILETCVQCRIPVVQVETTDIGDLSANQKTDCQKTEFCKGKSR